MLVLLRIWELINRPVHLTHHRIAALWREGMKLSDAPRDLLGPPYGIVEQILDAYDVVRMLRHC